MPKRDFLVVVRDQSGDNCYSQHRVAHSKDEAIINFARQIGIIGKNLAIFLDDNSGEDEDMVYAMPYWRDPKKMKKVWNVKKETYDKGNKLPAYLDKYRQQPELPPNRPERLATKQPREYVPKYIPTKSISPVPVRNDEEKTERELSDFAKDLLHHLKLEHVADREDGGYNN